MVRASPSGWLWGAEPSRSGVNPSVLPSGIIILPVPNTFRLHFLSPPVLEHGLSLGSSKEHRKTKKTNAL